MNPEKNEIQTKRIEESISNIGAKVANAVELSQKAKILSVNSETLLINVQQELEELYMSLDGSCANDKGTAGE